MSTNDDEQRAARARMANTGENYTAALRRIRGEGFPPGPRWVWPDTVIPADLHPGPVDPTNVVAVEPLAATSAISGFDPEAMVQAGMLSASYDEKTAEPFKASKEASGLIRLRLKKVLAEGKRPEWWLRFPSTLADINADGPWNPLDAMIWDEHVATTAAGYARVVAVVEAAMHRAAPEGFNGVLPYASTVNRPAHRGLFGLAGKLIDAARYDEALVVIENHLWLWPDRFVYTELLWELLDALQVPELGPRHRGPTEDYAAEHLASLPGRYSKIGPLEPAAPVVAPVIDPADFIDEDEQLAAAARLIPLVQGWTESNAAVVIDMLATGARMLWPRQVGGCIDSSEVGDAVGDAIARGASARGVLDCLRAHDACIGAHLHAECVDAIAARGWDEPFYVAPPPVSAVHLRRIGKSLGNVVVAPDIATSVVALAGRLLMDSAGDRFKVQPIADFIGEIAAEFGLAATSEDGLIAAEFIENAAIALELFVLGVAERSWGALNDRGAAAARVASDSVLPALYDSLSAVRGAMDATLTTALAHAQLVWDSDAAERNQAVLDRRRQLAAASGQPGN